MSLNTVSEWGSEDDAPPLSPTASPSTTFTAHQSRNVPQFDGLPPEVRVEIYRHLFEGAELVVSPITMQRSNKHDRNSPYRLIGGIDTSIIRTSRFIYAEALPYLADTTKLVIRRQESRNDPLENLHRDFLASIRSITVHIDTFVHIGRCRLPSLLRVQVVHEEVHLPSLPDVVEFLTGPDSAECMDELMEMMMEEVLSWKWKLHQFSLLGDWEGFDVTMTGVWRCFPETEAGVEFKINCVDGTIASSRAFIGDHETSLEDEAQVEKGWEAWSYIGRTQRHTPSADPGERQMALM